MNKYTTGKSQMRVTKGITGQQLFIGIVLGMALIVIIEQVKIYLLG